MPDFSQPGNDGALLPGMAEWQRGMVYTARPEIPSQLLPGHEYRISAALKKRIAEGQEFTGYEELYQRVKRVINARIARLVCPGGDEPLHTWIVCQGWGCPGAPYNIAIAFLTIGLICPKSGDAKPQGESPPAPALLMAPRGSTLEELARANPQRADEFYNEFDFTDPSSAGNDPVILSYGERVPASEGIDFEPFVKRAEKLAKVYYGLLEEPFQILRREWYSVTSPDLAVVQIYFRG